MNSDGEAPEKRDWGNLREWLNVIAAIGALLVGIVTFWTTARISGLEDYLRSEISRRNSDLNAISNQTQRLSALAEERAERLANLQNITDQVTANNLVAQSRLIVNQQELSRLGVDIISARQTISEERNRLYLLNEQASRQSSIIELFRRQRLSEAAFSRIAFVRLSDIEKDFSGESVYNEISHWTSQQFDRDLHPYFADFHKNALRTCKSLASYSPSIPPKIEYPDGPKRPGSISSDGNSYLMTNKEYERWNYELKEWNKRYSDISAANNLRFEAQQKSSQYLFNAASHCICQALATEDQPIDKVCPGKSSAPPATPAPDRNL